MFLNQTGQERAWGTLYQTATASDFELLVEKVECCWLHTKTTKLLQLQIYMVKTCKHSWSVLCDLSYWILLKKCWGIEGRYKDFLLWWESKRSGTAFIMSPTVSLGIVSWSVRKTDCWKRWSQSWDRTYFLMVKCRSGALQNTNIFVIWCHNVDSLLNADILVIWCHNVDSLLNTDTFVIWCHQWSCLQFTECWHICDLMS